MQREIKFRGLCAQTNKWVYGYYMKATDNKIEKVIIFSVGNNVIDKPVEVIPSTVGQFTGLKDKNGIDAYEGDITNIGTIEFSVGCFWVRNPNNYTTLFIMNECEITGNIHEQ